MSSLILQGQILTVIDQRTDEPIDFVTIYSSKPNASASTNAAGQADISAFRGAESIEIRYIGYETIELSYDALEDLGFVVRLEHSGVFLEQVVISASRWSQRSRDIPGRIASIARKETALQNPQTAADMLSTSGEVFIQKSQQGGGSPMIRGFATNRLLYAVDGVRMNTAIFRSGNIQNVISLDPFAIESTEVLFGPGSVIYGSDAIGGIMSFTTLAPQHAVTDETLVSGNAVARYASANSEKSVHFDVNAGWHKWALLSSFSSNDYGDLRMGSHGPDEYLKTYYIQRVDSIDRVFEHADPQVQRPSGFQQINLMQKVRFTPSDAWDFQLGVHYSATTDAPRYDRLLRLRNGLPRSAEWYYGPQVWMMNHLSIAHNTANTFSDQWSLRVAHQRFEESRIDRDLNDAIRFIRKERVNAFSANLDLHKTLGIRNKLFYGLEAIIDDVSSEGTDENIITGTRQPGSSRYPQATWSSYGVYVSYQHRFSDRVLAQAGTRYSHFVIDADFSDNLPFFPLPFTKAELNNGALTGSLGLVLNPQENLTISANLSTGFRAPNVDDMGKIFDSTPGSVVVPNPDLDAEYAYNAEAGLAKVFGERLRVDLTGYYTVLDNALVRRNSTLDGQDSILYAGELSQVEAIQNAATATVYGVQAGVEIKFGAGFSLMTRFNYQNGEEEMDDGSQSPLRHAAPWFGVSRLMYASGGLDLQLYAMFSGEVSFDQLSREGMGTPHIFAMDANGNPYSPGWVTLNLKVSCVISDALSISGGVENIMDKRYRPYSSGLASAGRNVILALRARF